MNTITFKKIGDYNLLEHLGSGALGSTYLAEHRFLKKQFVIKILFPELSNNTDFIDRFERETSLLASLEHPNIVKVHTVSESDGYYYLVTDAVVNMQGDSLNLHDYFQLKGRKLPEEEVIKIFSGIASALDYLHEKGHPSDRLAHRGLKPTNILLKKTSEGLQVQISDIGLSKIMGPSNYLDYLYRSLENKNLKTTSPYFKGPSSFFHHYIFLAPEQKLEKNLTSGVRIDTYAVGVVLYFLLTGIYPEGFFSLPSQISPHYKTTWDKVVQKCLHQDAEKRPLILGDLVKELFLEETPNDGASSQPSPINLKPIFKPTEIKRPEYESDPGAIFNTELIVARYTTTPQEQKKDISPLLTKMVVVKGGTFERGSNQGGRDELPRHQIVLNAFAIDIHPVTNEQFVQFLDVMGGEKDHNNNDILRLRESRIKRLKGKLSIESGYAKHPVVGITWYGAVAYAKWVGKRLPTEAEWEIAATGGIAEFIYPTGIDIDKTQANYFSSDTTAVMSYPPNPLNLYDMAGNVYEWCQDWYDYHYYNISSQEPQSPEGPHQGVYRVLRGGCWKSLKEDLRCAYRHRNNPGTINKTYGFRCAADVNASEN
jgi:formylglycine-generating enzyme required for sulfatase activity